VLFCSVLCFQSTDSLISANAKFVLPYKYNCIKIANTFNFLTLKNRPIRWRTLYYTASKTVGCKLRKGQ